jgi:hypothetical protein
MTFADLIVVVSVSTLKTATAAAPITATSG